MAKADSLLLPAPSPAEVDEKALTVVSHPSPFDSRREVVPCQPGATIEEILILMGIDGRRGRPLVWLNGEAVKPELWARVRPKHGTTLTVNVVPHGGRTGKAILTVLIGVALVVSAVFTGGATLSAISAGTAGLGALAAPVAAGLGGLATIASGIYSLATPPPAVPFSGDVPTSKQSPALLGTRNTFRPYAPVERRFGETRAIPSRIGSYTELVGSNQYLRMLFCFGYGPLQVEDIKIGETPIDEIRGEYNVLPGFDDDPEFSIFTRGVSEETFSIALKDGMAWALRVTDTDTRDSVLTIAHPGGLIAFDDKTGNPRDVEIKYELQHREVGSGVWIDTVLNDPPPGVLSDNTQPGVVIIHARRRGSWTRGLPIRFPNRGQWEVRLRRIEQLGGDVTNDDTFSDAFWTSLTSGRSGTPPRVPNLCYLEARFRSTDQLNGVVDTLSAKVTSILPIWTAVDGWGPPDKLSTNVRLFPTRSPAWAYAEWLRGSCNPRPFKDEVIDAPRLAEWAIKTDAEGRYFDAAVDFETTVWETARNIARSGRADYNVTDGKYSVVINEPKATVVQHFTPRNSKGFRAARTFKNPNHAIRVKFTTSADMGSQVEERVVYNDGYSEAGEVPGTLPAEEFGEMELWGISDADIAYRDARFHMASAELQPTIYSKETDIEHLPCQRGDLIVAANDVMLVGISQGRLTRVDIQGNQVIGGRMDEEMVSADPEKEYGVRIRAKDGTSFVGRAITLASDPREFAFVPPILGGAIDPEKGDLCMFGEFGKEVGNYVVSAVSPRSDLTAVVEFLDYSEAVFNADTEPIPPFDPQITSPTPVQLLAPQKPQILGVISDERALLVNPDGVSVPRMLVSVDVLESTRPEPEFFQLQFRQTNPIDDWITLPMVSATVTQIAVEGVEEGITYDIRIRTVGNRSVASDFTPAFGHTVVGASAPPPDVLNTRTEPGNLLAWDYPSPPNDLDGFLVRHQAGNVGKWETGIPAHDGVVSESLFALDGIPRGERTIMVKAVDRSGNQSVNAGFVVRDVGGQPSGNIVESIDFHNLGFPGTITAGSVNGGTGDLEADAEQNLFWVPPDNGPFWEDPDTDLFWGDGFAQMVYESEWEIPKEAFPGVITFNVGIAAAGWSLEYRLQGETEWKAFRSGVSVDEQPAANPTYEFRLITEAGAQQGVVSAYSVEVDVPDLVEKLYDRVVAPTGYILIPDLTESFRVITGIFGTVQDDGNGGTGIVVLSKSILIASVRVVDDTGTAVTGLVDLTIEGY